MVRTLLVDVAGLCVAARREDYVSATLAAVDRGGACTALGHTGSFDAFGAALVNGTAAHGFELDDHLDAAVAHPGAIVVSAALAAAESADAPGARLWAAPYLFKATQRPGGRSSSGLIPR